MKPPSAVSEFGQLVGEIAADGRDNHVEIADLVNKYAPLVAAARDASVADALNQQADFYWEASALLDPARMVAERNGEEAMTAVLDSQINTMREVSKRLRRRAMQFAGVPAEDQAIHAMATAAPAPTAPAMGPLSGIAFELGQAYFIAHPELDPKRTQLEFRNGEKGWHVSSHREVESPGSMDPCSCWAAGSGKCYCANSTNGGHVCDYGPCKKFRGETE